MPSAHSGSKNVNVNTMVNEHQQKVRSKDIEIQRQVKTLVSDSIRIERMGLGELQD